MKESELKMMIKEELEKIVSEEKIDEFLRQAIGKLGQSAGRALRRTAQDKLARAQGAAEKAIGMTRGGKRLANAVRGGIAGDNPARKAKELANKQSEQLKQVAAQLQQIVQFLNQMTK